MATTSSTARQCEVIHNAPEQCHCMQRPNGNHWHNNRRWNATRRFRMIMFVLRLSILSRCSAFVRSSCAMQRIICVCMRNEMKSIQNPLEFIAIKLVRFTTITFSGRSFGHISRLPCTTALLTFAISNAEYSSYFSN